MAPASSKEFLDIQANYRVWIHSETHSWHDNKIQSQVDITWKNFKQSFNPFYGRKEYLRASVPQWEGLNTVNLESYTGVTGLEK